MCIISLHSVTFLETVALHAGSGAKKENFILTVLVTGLNLINYLTNYQSYLFLMYLYVSRIFKGIFE